MGSRRSVNVGHICNRESDHLIWLADPWFGCLPMNHDLTPCGYQRAAASPVSEWREADGLNGGLISALPIGQEIRGMYTVEEKPLKRKFLSYVLPRVTQDLADQL